MQGNGKHFFKADRLCASRNFSVHEVALLISIVLLHQVFEHFKFLALAHVLGNLGTLHGFINRARP